MASRITLLLAGLSLGLASSASGQDGGPNRSGFTGEVGIGAAYVWEEGVARGNFGVAPISVSLGGFVTPDFAILMRAAAGVGLKDSATEGELVGVYGGQLQFWATDHLVIGLGGGVALYDEFIDSSRGQNNALGVGGSLRLGYSFWAGESATVRIATEALPVVIDGEFFLAQSLVLEWQGY